MKKYFFISGTIILLAILTGCGLVKAKIDRVYLASDQNGVNRVDSFERDSVFYIIVELKNAPDDTELKAVWTLVESDGEKLNTRLDETIIKTGSGKITFSLKGDSDWQGGSYQVEIYLNGDRQETIHFSVAEPPTDVFG
ncbi:MAG: hypothetical protein HY862_07770 [Chloroflexi bacterium]|nr:hypothetical protein [Chloroflexota bacterium]